MNEALERATTAAEEHMFAPHELPLDNELHAKYLQLAHAIIASIREPTPEMVEAALVTFLANDMKLTKNGLKLAYQAMIDELLK